MTPSLAGRERVMIANVGNFHTLAFRLGKTGIEGVFEHHTGLLGLSDLEHLLRALADGSLAMRMCSITMGTAPDLRFSPLTLGNG